MTEFTPDSAALGHVTPPAPARIRAGEGRGWTRLGVRSIALLYLGLLLVLPIALIFLRTFDHGIEPVLKALRAPQFQSAFWLTITIAAIAVPINTVFGVIAAMTLVRRRFPGRGLLNAIIDLPFALSPVVIGLSLVLVYGKSSWIGGFLDDHGIKVIFAMPGMVLATIFVSLPFVVREVMPVLREVGTDQEEAASTLGSGSMRTFWRITLPAIKWGVIYGVILTTARSLGEFGAVSIVSGKIAGKTQTLTLYVEDRYEGFQLVAAYTASIVLALMALVVLGAMSLYQSGRFRRRRNHGDLGQPSDQAVR
ncbi:MAG: sulfate ABC transporter permease subunit CysW [Chloroflexota bacterium]